MLVVLWAVWMADSLGGEMAVSMAGLWGVSMVVTMGVRWAPESAAV